MCDHMCGFPVCLSQVDMFSEPSQKGRLKTSSCRQSGPQRQTGLTRPVARCSAQAVIADEVLWEKSSSMDEMKFRCLGFVLEMSSSITNTRAPTHWHALELECAEREAENTMLLQACSHMMSHRCRHGHVT